MKPQKCICGHEAKMHTDSDYIGVGQCGDINGQCSCEKFQSQDNKQEHGAHSTPQSPDTFSSIIAELDKRQKETDERRFDVSNKAHIQLMREEWKKAQKLVEDAIEKCRSKDLRSIDTYFVKISELKKELGLNNG